MLTGNDAEAPTAAATTAATSVGEDDGEDNNNASADDEAHDNASNDDEANNNDKKDVGKMSLQEVFAQWEVESADELMVSTCQEVCAECVCRVCMGVCLSRRLT
jgi:hypothetical protein